MPKKFGFYTFPLPVVEYILGLNAKCTLHLAFRRPTVDALRVFTSRLIKVLNCHFYTTNTKKPTTSKKLNLKYFSIYSKLLSIELLYTQKILIYLLPPSFLLKKYLFLFPLYIFSLLSPCPLLISLLSLCPYPAALSSPSHHIKPSFFSKFPSLQRKLTKKIDLFGCNRI